MSQSLKKAVQNALLLPRKKQYEKDLNRLLKEHEKRCEALYEYVSSDAVKEETKSLIERLEIEKVLEDLNAHVSYEDSRFFLVYDASLGILRNESERIVFEYIKNNPCAVMLYGDEDYFAVGENFEEKDVIRASKTIRFFKPCFSPDTLASFDYINAFAVKGEVLNSVIENNKDELSGLDKDSAFYELGIDICAKLKDEKKEDLIRHIPYVFVSTPLRIDDEFEKIPPLFSEDKYKDVRNKAVQKLKLISEKEDPFVSIIIPSKDNPDMLISCIKKLELSTLKNAELIVVDNGSADENKTKIGEFLNSCGFENKYIYEAFEFNYSKMNNIAAAQAKGEVLLLLNDDIEADGNAWIDVFRKKATEEGVGCVGCKLVYPDGKIQHVGIAGGVDGPAHVFMGEEDNAKLGFGTNRVNRNVLAVTGACLAVRKSLYDEAGGLCEELKVGYNDVDLCMTLFEKGYRNVILNDIKLVHHESVSRGRDAKNKSKSERLFNEKEILRSRHKDLCITDPYEGGSSDFKLEFERANEDKNINASVKSDVRKANDEEGWIYSSFEELRVEKEDGKNVLFAKGFALVPGIDNMRFDFDLLLEKEGDQFVIPVERNLRTDLSGRFNGSLNTELCGMDIRASLEGLSNGTYFVKMYAKDHGNVRELITDTGHRINIQV